MVPWWAWVLWAVWLIIATPVAGHYGAKLGRKRR
jgi:hypothetical protein